MRVQALSKMVFILLGAVLTLAPLTTNASEEEVPRRSYPRPAVCNYTFQDYRTALRMCKGMGIIRRFDGFQFVGYGCNCSAWDDPYIPAENPQIPSWN